MILVNLVKWLRPFLVYLFSFLFSPVKLSFLLLASSGYLYVSELLRDKNKKFLWRKPLRNLFRFWRWHGYFWHGYEITGLENIPKNKPALLIFYHASFFSIDILYFVSHIFIERNRLIRTVIERDLTKKNGIQTLAEMGKTTTGSVSECVELLKSNQFVLIAPGGAREALFSKNYEILWGNRSGFAKVAYDAKVSIIPIFTVNSQEAFKLPPYSFLNMFRSFYETFRFVCVGPFSWFPVKLKTIVGKPIEFDETRTIDELVEMTKGSIQRLIDENQNKKNSFYYSLVERYSFSISK